MKATEFERCDACGGYLRLDGTCADECFQPIDDGLSAARGIIAGLVLCAALWTVALVGYLLWHAYVP